MVTVLLILNAVICVALIAIILAQRSDPASGGMFGGAGGGSQPVVRNPMARPTAILAGLFLLFSVLAAVLNNGGGHGETVMANAPAAPAHATLPEAALLPSTTITATTVSNTAVVTTTTVISPTH